MKKLTVFIVCFITCFLMTGCSLFGGEHSEHKFKSAWETNSAYHWHECKYNKCKERGEYEVHTFENGKCIVCGYKQQSFSSQE